MQLDISDAQLSAIFARFVVRYFPCDDPEWSEIVARVRRENRQLRRRRRWLGWLSQFRRTQRGLAKAYSLQWAETSIEAQLASTGVAPFEWRGQGSLASVPCRKRLHQLFLTRAVAQLAPAHALEVGCGNGLNLFLLAGRFPAVRFQGIELTAGGVAAAHEVIAQPELPRILLEFAVEPLLDPEAHRRVDVRQANATALPFPSRSVDLVFAVLALEQMEEVRHRALAEIARVAKRHVVMVEPFRDWNADGLRRDYIVGKDYFSARTRDLQTYGLRPLLATADMPNKVAYAVGVVVCEVV